jgi:hypothetical protein
VIADERRARKMQARLDEEARRDRRRHYRKLYRSRPEVRQRERKYQREYFARKRIPAARRNTTIFGKVKDAIRRLPFSRWL